MTEKPWYSVAQRASILAECPSAPERERQIDRRARFRIAAALRSACGHVVTPATVRSMGAPVCMTSSTVRPTLWRSSSARSSALVSLPSF
jgi:hypothetical protein